VLLRVAAVLTAVPGVGFGLFCVLGIGYFARTGRVWTFSGMSAYGNGPFERIGVPTSLPLLFAFLLVCVGEVVAAWLPWRLRPAGVRLAWHSCRSSSRSGSASRCPSVLRPQ